MLSINWYSSAHGIRSCLANFSMRGDHLASAATHGMGQARINFKDDDYVVVKYTLIML